MNIVDKLNFLEELKNRYVDAFHEYMESYSSINNFFMSYMISNTNIIELDDIKDEELKKSILEKEKRGYNLKTYIIHKKENESLYEEKGYRIFYDGIKECLLQSFGDSIDQRCFSIIKVEDKYTHVIFTLNTISNLTGKICATKQFNLFTNTENLNLYTK